MWRKILSFLLVVNLICGFIGSIIITNSVGWRFWWIMPVCWVITLLTSATTGTIVEIAKRSEENQEMLYRLSSEIRNSRIEGSPQQSSANSYQKASLVDRLRGTSGGNAPEYWHCSKCGESNPMNTTFCKSCGEYK